VAIPTIWWVVTHRLPPADRRIRFAADPLPEALDTEKERAAYRARTWRDLDANLLVKVVLISLLCVIFGEILPRNTASAAQIALVVSVVVVLNSVTSLAFSRRRISIERVPVDFVAVAALNVLIFVVLREISARFVLDHALFFALLISLIVVLYDRYRPVRDYRVAAASNIARDTAGRDRPQLQSS
jgi:Na+/glutamate symporter